MHFIRKDGFTLVELMVVIMILGVLFTGLYMGVQPYLSRSRDTKRMTDIQSYTNILDTYDKNFDTFPSNYGSGGPAILGYCLTELAARADNPSEGLAGKFSALRVDTSHPPTDPMNQMTYAPICDMTGSYIYSRMTYGTGDSQIAIIAARLELASSANYSTGSDLINPLKIPDILRVKKGTAEGATSDMLYVVSILH